MCGRYYIEISDATLREICEEVLRKQQGRESTAAEQLTIKFDGEVFPTDVVPVQTGSTTYQPMQWGFTGFQSKRPVINARSETVLVKPMFQYAIREHRCLIPASGYYEWRTEGARKIKYRLYDPQHPLFFAGCYRQELNSDLARFVILTRAATDELALIHERMPVIIPRGLATMWLNESPYVMDEAITNLEFQPV